MKSQHLKGIAMIAAATATVAAASAQSGMSGRIFTYDGSPATNGTIAFAINGSVFSPAGPLTVGNNGITNEGPAGASFALDLAINVQTFIYVYGSFDADYKVTGFGGQADQTRFNDVEIRTNRNLTVLSAGFSGLTDLTHPANKVVPGSITYSLEAFQGYPYVGGSTMIGNPVTGRDDAFSGKSLTIQVSELPSSGQATLRMARVLSLNSAALGATTYRANGTLILTVS